MTKLKEGDSNKRFFFDVFFHVVANEQHKWNHITFILGNNLKIEENKKFKKVTTQPPSTSRDETLPLVARY